MKNKTVLCVLMFIVLLSGCVKSGVPNKDSVSSASVESGGLQEKEAKESQTENDKTQDVEPEIKKSSISGKIIAIDAGHGINSYNKQEAIAPNSSETKIAFASGTSGVNQTEEELNLAVAFKLQDALDELGAETHMTRTEHNSDMTNIDRAEFANKINADISVKLHADGNNSSSVHGVSVLVPGSKYISDNNVIEKSRNAGELILAAFVESTGATNRGISVRNDLTGFNWTQVPIVLIEMGFMTNPDEDKLMETEEYQNKMVQGIVSGLEKYFEAN